MKSFRSYITKLDRSVTAQPRRIDRKKVYRALLATTIIAGSQLLSAICATANDVPTPSIPNPLVPTREVLNPSFETPLVTNWSDNRSSSTTGNSTAPALGTGSTANVAGGNIREAYNESAYNKAQYNLTTAPIIWRSTETGGTRSQYGYSDAIEVWRGNPGNGGQGPASGFGSQYAELNGSGNASLYQDLCILPNENVGWSLLHAVRQNGSGDPTNIMQVSITDPTGWANSKTPPAAQANAYYSSLGDFSRSGTYPTVKNTVSPDPITLARPFIATKYTDGWKSYNGSWTSTNTSPKLLRFAFGAIQGSGSTTYGNFIDDVRLRLSAIIDFLPTAGGNVNLASHTEGNATNYYYLSLRVNGTMTSSSQVRIPLTGLNARRSFRLGSVLKGSATATGLTATIDGNNILLNIPAGTYNPNLPSDYIHIPIDFSDNASQTNDNLIFTLQSVVSGPLGIKGEGCGTRERITVEVALTDDDYQKRVELPIRIAAH